jgi:hypothetical protein
MFAVAAHLWCARCAHPSASRLAVSFTIGSHIGFWQMTQQNMGSFASMKVPRAKTPVPFGDTTPLVGLASGDEEGSRVFSAALTEI